MDGFGIKPQGSYYDPADAKTRGFVSDVARNAEAAREDEQLRKVCQDFESMFLYLMMKEMRKTVPETKLFHGGRAEEIFRDMMDEELSKDMAKGSSGGLGIGSMLYQQLKRPVSGM